MRKLFVSLLTMALFASTSFSKTPAPAEVTSPTLPTTKAGIFTLPNGLTVILDEDHSSPVVSVQAWSQTGSVDEDKWLGAGLSHILEHMLFKGTESRATGGIDKEIQARGGYINAYTSFDRTVYYIDVPSEGVSEAIDILADVMMNATLPRQEYDKEQEVIRREFDMGFDDPDRVNSKLLFSTVFAESPYRHPVIGYLDIYNKLTREDVFAYYKKRYVPNNVFFVIVGAFDSRKVRTQLETYFAKYPRKPIEPVYVPPEPVQTGRREVHEEFPTELTRLSLAWRIPPVTSPDMPALDVLGTVLGGGDSSPLYQEIREKKALAYSIEAGSYALATDGIFVIQAVCDPDKRESVETGSLAILETIKRDGVSAKELEKARKSLLSSQLGALTTARGMASDHGSNWLLTRNLNFSRDYLNAIDRVTVDDLQRVARQYLAAGKLNVVSLNPTGSLKKTESAATEAREAEVQKFELPNGLKLLVRENHRLPLVSMIATFKGGVLAEVAEDNGISRLMSHAMLKGTESRSAREIASQIESVGGGISGDSGNNSFSVSVSVMKPDLALGMNLLADVLIHPTFPEAEISREKAAQIAGIKAEDDQMTAVARNVLRENLFGSHPYALRGTGRPETVASLTQKQVRDFHERLAVAKNGVLAVFGDVDAAEVFRLARRAFSSMPAGEEGLTDLAPPPAVETSRTVTAERKKNQAIVMIGYPGIDLYSKDRPAMELIDTASSDLGSRFFDRIREKLGLAYFVGTMQLVGPTPGAFIFYLGTDPAKVERVRAELKDEIAKLASEGLTPEELARARKKLLGAEAIRDQSDSAMAQVIALDELFGLGANYHNERKNQIEAVTVEDTRRVAQHYFGASGNIETIVAPPAATPSPTPGASH